jgi:hypothetical protein
MWAAALVTVASMFMLVAFHVLAAQSAFTLDRLAKERTNEQLRYERLRNQVATESSAESVRSNARRLGMVPGEHIPTLTASGITATPPAVGSSSGADAPTAPLAPDIYDKTKKHLGP